MSVSQQDFATTLTISSYSLIALTHSLEPLFREKKASVTALSFLGSQQIVSGYGVMSIAKASLEATAMQLAHSLVIFYSSFYYKHWMNLTARGLEGFE